MGFTGKKQFAEDEPYSQPDAVKDRNDTMTAPAVPNQFDESLE